MYDELLKRLDNRRESYYNGLLQSQEWLADDDCRNAAVAIRALTAKLEAVKRRPIEEAKPREIYLVFCKGEPFIAFFDPIAGGWMDNQSGFRLRVTRQPTQFVSIAKIKELEK